MATERFIDQRLYHELTEDDRRILRDRQAAVREGRASDPSPWVLRGVQINDSAKTFIYEMPTESDPFLAEGPAMGLTDRLLSFFDWLVLPCAS